MTVQITVLSGSGGATTLPSGGAFTLVPGMVIQLQDVLPDGTLGPVWDPASLVTTVAGNDLVVILPNGETLLLIDAVPLLAGGPLEQLVVAGLPEDEAEPGAGPGGDGGGPSGGGSIQAAFPFENLGFGTDFGQSQGGGFGPGGLAGLTIPDFDPNTFGIGGPASPVPQLATFAFSGMTMGLEDKPIPLLTAVTQNDIEGLGEILTLTISDIPEGITLVNSVTGTVLIVGAAGGSSISVPPSALPQLAVIPPADSDADFTVTLVATTFEPSNPPAGTAVSTAILPVVVKAVADPAKITLDNLIAAEHLMGVAKNPIQQEMEGRGATGANDTADDAQDLGTLPPIPTPGNPGPVITVDGWINVNDPNDVDLYKIEITQDGAYKFDVDFGDTGPAGNENGRIDDADPRITLYDATGKFIAEDDDDGPGLDPELSEVLTAGTYFVAVTHAGNSSLGSLADGFSGLGDISSGGPGDYELSIQLDGPDAMPGDMFTHMVIEDNAQIMTRVAVFDDPAFVDTADPTTGTSESDEIQASIAAFGHAVSTFAGTDKGSWDNALANADVVVVPELENGNLGQALSDPAIAAINTFVTNGGKLIIAGNLGDNAENFLDSVFGVFSLDVEEVPGSGPSSLAPGAAGTAFEGGPNSLQPLGNQALEIGSLPLGVATPIYLDGNGNATVVQFNIGTGRVFYLGDDWWRTEPAPGSQDGGWNEVLGRALGAAGAMIPPAERMYVDPTEESFRTRRADIDLMVTDTDGSESITRVSITTDPTPPGLMLDLNGDGSFDMAGDRVTLDVTTFGTPPVAGTLDVTLASDPATGALFFEIPGGARVQSIDLSSFSWKVAQHNDQDFAIKFEVRTTETDPTEGAGTLDETQVATPHAYQTATIMVNAKAVADKPTLTIGSMVDCEDNAERVPPVTGPFMDNDPVFAIQAMAMVTDTDLSESLTEVKIDWSALPTVTTGQLWIGTPPVVVTSGPLMLDVVTDMGAETVTAQVAITGQTATLTFLETDRVQSVNLEQLGLRLPQHKHGKFDILIEATATETNPSEAGDVAVPHQTQTATFTLDVQAVADPALVSAPSQSDNEDKATLVSGMYVDGVSTYTTPFFARLQDEDGSEAITVIKLTTDFLTQGLAANEVGVQLINTLGPQDLGTLDNLASSVIVDVRLNDAAMTSTRAEATLTGSGGELTLTFAESPPIANVSMGRLKFDLPQHKDGVFNIDWMVTTKEVAPMGDIKAGAETAVVSGNFSFTVGAVADKAMVTADPVMADEDNATKTMPGMYADGISTYGLPFSASVTDSDDSESITSITIEADNLPTGASFTLAPGGLILNGVGLNPPAPGLVSATAVYAGTPGMSDLTLVFNEAERVQSVDILGSNLSVDLPQHLHGTFDFAWSVTTKETNPMGATPPTDKLTAVESGVLTLTVDAVADKPQFTNVVTNVIGATGIPLDFKITTPDSDGSEGLSEITVSGLPAGSSLSFAAAGGGTTTVSDDDGDGSITINLTTLTDSHPGATFENGKLTMLDASFAGGSGFNLILTPPPAVASNFTVTVTATSMEMDDASAPIALADQSDFVEIQVAIGNPPVVDLDESSLLTNNFATLFKEDGSTTPTMPVPGSGPVPIGDISPVLDILVTDPDNDPIDRVVVTLMNAPDGSDEALSVLAGVPTEIIPAIAPSGHSITFTNRAGLATEAHFETALSLVRYNNVSDTPSTSTREIDVVATDTLGISSDPATAFINVMPANDAPVARDDAFNTTEAAVEAGTVELGNVLDDNGGGGPDSDVDSTMLSIVGLPGFSPSFTGLGAIAVASGTTATGFVTTFGTSEGSVDLFVGNDGAISFMNQTGDPFGRLPAGQSGTFDGIYRLADDQGATSTATVTVTVTGDNDPPVALDDEFGTDSADIDAGTNLVGNVVNNPDGRDTDLDGDPLMVTGVVTGTGFDNSGLTFSSNFPASFINTVMPTAPGGNIVYQADINTDIGDAVLIVQDNGDVFLDASSSTDAFDALQEQREITFDYILSDGAATTTASVTIEIGPKVWFIDNDPGSHPIGALGIGSDVDPFQSIAAFNAANGTVGGPQPGDIIFLRSGENNEYNEPNGFDLLDRQTLIGQGQALGFGSFQDSGAGDAPTINVTGLDNHGIELAQNNTIRGLNIGDTSGKGAGIDDGGGVAGVGTLTISDVAISGTGKAFDVDSSGTLAVTFESITSTGSGGEGIDINNVGGSFSVTGNTSITDSSGTGVDITNSTGAFSFGGLDIDNSTSNQLGLNVAASGTIEVTGTGNVLNTGGATAVDISNTTIGTDGITFESVTSTAGTNVGISLDNAGSGGFAITGNTMTPAAGSGGTISGKAGFDGATTTGIGVFINDTDNVDLSQMQLNDFSNFAIRGTNVDGFELIDSVIDGVNGNSGALDEGSVSFDELTGTVSIHGSDISGGFENNIVIVNTSGTLNFDMDDTTSNQMVVGLNGTTTNAGDSMLIEAQGGATVNVVVENTNFTGARQDLFHAKASGNLPTLDVTLRDNNFNNTHPNTSTGANGGGRVFIEGTGTNIDIDYLIEGSGTGTQMFNGAVGSAILVRTTTASSGTVTGTIQNNAIGTSGVPGSGSVEGSGITAGSQGTVQHDVTIHANTIRSVGRGFTGNAGIEVFNNTDTPGGGVTTMTAVITNNNVAELGGLAFTGLWAYVGDGGGSQDGVMNLDVRDNVFDASAALLIGSNAVFLSDRASAASFNLPLAYMGSDTGEDVLPVPGTASTDVSSFYAGQGNTLINGPHVFPPVPAGATVDATTVENLTTSNFLRAAAPAGEDSAAGVKAGLEDVAALTEAAIERWLESGISEEQLAALEGAMISVADLSGDVLAVNMGGAIVVDIDAAGHGWFVDTTPFDDAEFETVTSDTSLLDGDGPAAGAMDLLTVLMHELGHSLGLPDLYDAGSADELMAATLEAGTRKLPEPAGEALQLADVMGQAALPDATANGGTGTTGGLEEPNAAIELQIVV